MLMERNKITCMRAAPEGELAVAGRTSRDLWGSTDPRTALGHRKMHSITIETKTLFLIDVKKKHQKVRTNKTKQQHQKSQANFSGVAMQGQHGRATVKQ